MKISLIKIFIWNVMIRINKMPFEIAYYVRVLLKVLFVLNYLWH